MRNTYSSNISSSSLYHFTKDATTIISILKNGFYPRTAIEDISVILPAYKEARVGIPMVCFTDIPLSESAVHRAEYGNFGIGLKKEWGIAHGLNPVCYVVEGSEMYKAYNHLQAKVVGDYARSDLTAELPELMNAFMNYGGFLKVYTSDPSLQTKPFYDEREWRYLPPFIDSSSKGRCNRLVLDDVDRADARNALNQKMQSLYALKFSVDDISQIVLPSDYSINDFENLLKKSNLPTDYRKYLEKAVNVDSSIA